MKQKFNKKIGLLGGAGPWASAYAHEHLIKLAQWDYGAVQDHEYPDILHVSEALEGFGARGVEQDQIIAEQLLKTFALFQSWGAEIAIIACNSLHRYYEKIAAEYQDIHVVHLPREGADVLKNRNIEAAAVLCSASSRQDRLHAIALENVNIRPILPTDAQQKRCDAMIETIMAGDETARTFRDFRSLTKEFADQGAQSVISGCTELSWLAHKVQPDLPVVDCLNAALETTLKLAAIEPN